MGETHNASSLDLIQAINEALEYANDRESFIENMEVEGYEVSWVPNRKHIAFTCPNGCKCRDRRLHDETSLKENLEALFAYRQATGFRPCTPEPDEGWLRELATDWLRVIADLERDANQPIYVDGQRVPMTAYAIGGSNYVRLRDIGQAMDFTVDYDAAANSVLITSDRPYQQEMVHTTSITEESVKASLAELKTIYPDGVIYPTPYRSTSNGPYSRGIHCSGWTTLCSDAAFGDLPWRRINRPSWEQLRPGDLVEYKNANAYHVVVVVKKTDEYISVTESGNHNKALWGGQYFKWWLEEQPHYICYTR